MMSCDHEFRCTMELSVVQNMGLCSDLGSQTGDTNMRTSCDISSEPAQICLCVCVSTWPGLLSFGVSCVRLFAYACVHAWTCHGSPPSSPSQQRHATPWITKQGHYSRCWPFPNNFINIPWARLNRRVWKAAAWCLTDADSIKPGAAAKTWRDN